MFSIQVCFWEFKWYTALFMTKDEPIPQPMLKIIVKSHRFNEIHIRDSRNSFCVCFWRTPIHQSKINAAARHYLTFQMLTLSAKLSINQTALLTDRLYHFVFLSSKSMPQKISGWKRGWFTTKIVCIFVIKTTLRYTVCKFMRLNTWRE